MTPFIDVNIWIYLFNKVSPFHHRVSDFLAPYTAGQKDFLISWQVVYEFIRIATDPRAFENPTSWQNALQFIRTISNFSNVRVLQETSSHTQALQYVIEKSGYTRGTFIHDCHIAALLHEHGVKEILTADQDFQRFGFLNVTDPTIK